MRQQGLRHGGGIQPRASGVQLTVSFLSGVGDGMWPKGCGDVLGQKFVRVSSCATLGLTQRGFIEAFGPLGMQDEARQFVYRALYRVHLDEPALMSIRDGVNHGLPLGAERFREQVEAAIGLRVGLRKQGRKAEPAVKPLPGQLGLNI